MANKHEPKKCANASCGCIPSDGSKYCSAHCEGVGKATELVCRCGHPGCSVDASTSQ